MDQGGLGFSHKWNLGWMHDTLGYLSLDPEARQHHGEQVTLPLRYAHDERFVLPLGHDEVVHGKGSLLSKMGGDDRQRFAALRMLFAWQWASPGAPLVFMGSELAPWEEWTEQDAPAVAPARTGRHIEGCTIWSSVSTTSPTTGRRCGGATTSPAGSSGSTPTTPTTAMYAFVRWDLDGVAAVVCIANFTDVARRDYRVGLPWGGRWDVVLDTDALDWNGGGFRRDGRGRNRRAVAGLQLVGGASMSARCRWCGSPRHRPADRGEVSTVTSGV